MKIMKVVVNPFFFDVKRCFLTQLKTIVYRLVTPIGDFQYLIDLNPFNSNTFVANLR